MEDWLGGSVTEFILVTVIIFGFAGLKSGQALAMTWRPVWQVLLYGLILAAANRFLSYALFFGQLLSVSGYIVDFVVICGIGVTGYRLTRAHQLVTQYPWLYERAGLFSWRKRGEPAR
jgi:hypothetical protein